MIILSGVVLLFVVVGTVLFVNLSPEFGGKISEKQQKLFALSPQYKNGKFNNAGNITLHIGLRDMGKSAIGYFNPPQGTVPATPIPIERIQPESLLDNDGETRMYWFGHSTFLLQIQSKNILIDPMFGEVPAPHPFLGKKRFSKNLPLDIADLPKIDAVLISHDHYDHLDYGSIIKLKDKVNMFYTPLGVGVHLKAWGIPENRIVELDWWQDAQFTDLKFICTPAQHFSGRGFGDRGNTLWSSWVIQSETDNIFFSGDSGYGPHFKAIGDKYGPFNFAMMECGQYNSLWHEIHMFPEETAQAALDLNVKRFMPIHWGAFKLAMHEWTEPVERLEIAANKSNLEIVTPKIGDLIVVNNSKQNFSRWWQ